MSRPLASFVLAQVLLGGVVVATLFLGSDPAIVARGQITPTPTGTVTPPVTPSPTVTPTPTPGPVAVNDTYSTAYGTTLTVPAPGVLANDVPNGGGALTAQLLSSPAYGALTFDTNGGFTYVPTCVGTHSFTYQASNMAGASAVATVSISVQAPGSVQPPCGLYVSSVAGDTVTLRWERPASGPVPTGYVLEGGLNPGELLASIPTNSPYPIYRFIAPTGSFFIRMTALDGGTRSVESNEVPLHVNVPVRPSPPASLVGLGNGSAITLAWRNTFGGGPPTSLLLDVTGAATTTIPLALTDAFTFDAVPPGTYTVALRAANAAGPSAPSNALTLTFPATCTGVPNPPTALLGYLTGSFATALWEPPPSGPAPTGYILDVSGTFVGSFQTSGRSLGANVGTGTYDLAVRAVNPCGISAPSPVSSITVP
ncbi:MAG: Ig-like domain-containing protein [Vicinamibacterales bacterium]